MALTLRILVHELEEHFGPVEYGNTEEKRQFVDVRLVGDNADDPTCLYVADPKRIKDCNALEDIVFLAVGPSAQSSDCCIALKDDVDSVEVFTFLQETFRRYNTWLNEMDYSIINDQGIQRLFDLSEEFLMNNVILVDPALKLLAYTKGIPTDDDVTQELITHGYHTEENIRKFQINKRFNVWAKQNGFIINDSKSICKYTTAVYSFKTTESFSLLFVMMCNNIEPEPWLLDVAILFLIRVAFYSQRDYSTDSPAGSSVKSFMRDMLDETLTSPAEIEERSRHLGLPVEGHFCLFYITLGNQQHLTARIIADISRQTAPAKSVIYEDAIIVLCFNCHDKECRHACETGKCPMHHSTVTSRLNKTMKEYGLRAGRSAGFEYLSDMPTAYRQARAALQASGKKGFWQDLISTSGELSSLSNFDDCYFDYLVDKGLGNDRNMLAGLQYCRILMDMYESDLKNNTDNCRFLFEYLRCERRTTLVAEALHMHRNNVKYRVDRIEEQFNLQLDDVKQRYELMVAFRVASALGMGQHPDEEDVPLPASVE